MSNFEWPYLRNRWSDPLHVWFYGMVFRVCGSNGTIFGLIKPKMAVKTWQKISTRAERCYLLPNYFGLVSFAHKHGDVGLILNSTTHRPMAVRSFRWPVRRSGTRCPTSSEIRRVVLAVLGSFLRQSCLVITNVTSALEVFLNVRPMRSALYKSTFYLLTYLLVESSRADCERASSASDADEWYLWHEGLRRSHGTCCDVTASVINVSTMYRLSATLIRPCCDGDSLAQTIHSTNQTTPSAPAALRHIQQAGSQPHTTSNHRHHEYCV